MNDIGNALQKFGKLEQRELLSVTAQVSTDTRVLRDGVKHFRLATNQSWNIVSLDVKETKADMKGAKAEVKEFCNKLDMHERSYSLSPDSL